MNLFDIEFFIEVESLRQNWSGSTLHIQKGSKLSSQKPIIGIQYAFGRQRFFHIGRDDAQHLKCAENVLFLEKPLNEADENFAGGIGLREITQQQRHDRRCDRLVGGLQVVSSNVFRVHDQMHFRNGRRKLQRIDQ